MFSLGDPWGTWGVWTGASADAGEIRTLSSLRIVEPKPTKSVSSLKPVVPKPTEVKNRFGALEVDDDEEDDTKSSTEDANFFETYGISQDIILGMGVLFLLLLVALVLRGRYRSDYVEAWSPPVMHQRHRIGFDIPEAPNLDDDPWSRR